MITRLPTASPTPTTPSDLKGAVCRCINICVSERFLWPSLGHCKDWRGKGGVLPVCGIHHSSKMWDLSVHLHFPLYLYLTLLVNSLLKPPSYYAVFIRQGAWHPTILLLTCIPGGEGTSNYSLSCLVLQVSGLELRSNKHPVAWLRQFLFQGECSQF